MNSLIDVQNCVNKRRSYRWTSRPRTAHPVPDRVKQ